MAPTLRIRRGHEDDLDWLLRRHAVLYAELCGWGEAFVGYVREGMDAYRARHDPRRDVLLIAEQEGERVGAIALQHLPDRPGWLQLRWYLVESTARGGGVGTRLLDAALDHARRCDATGITLWTTDNLPVSRRRYERVGFQLEETAGPSPWDPTVREQRWELRLADAATPPPK